MVVLRSRLPDGRRVRVSLKKTRKRRRRDAGAVSIPRGPINFINRNAGRDTIKVKLRYVDFYNLDPAAGLTAVQSFRLNSCNDPDLTGVGHQPRGYDQYSALYNRYRVDKATIEVRAVPGPTATGQSGFMTLLIGTESTLPSASYYEAHELGNSVSCGMPNDASVERKLKLACVPSKLYTYAFDEDLLSANVGSNPGAIAYAHVVYLPQGGAANPGPVTLMVTIDMWVTFKNPILVAAS